MSIGSLCVSGTVVPIIWVSRSYYYCNFHSLFNCNISVFWRDHFSSILNSSGLSNADLKNSIMSKLDDVQYSENMIVSSRVTSKLISELDSGKSSGPDNISPESLKFASNRLSVLLSLCFSVCLSHGYLPPAMIT